MSWSVPDRDLAAVVERRLRLSLSQDPALTAPRRGGVFIDALRIHVPEGATAEQIGERITSGIADRLRGRDGR